MAARARESSLALAGCEASAKNAFLEGLAKLIQEREEEILAANRLDLQKAEEGKMPAARLDRLRLTPAIIAGMRQACLDVAAWNDPVGAVETQWKRPNGLLVGKMRVPLGVIAIIYEARPNVTIEAAILCVKAGNAVILRGGREALYSNILLCELCRLALEEAGLPVDAVQLVADVSHDAVLELCRMEKYIDLIIPRGGEKLVAAVKEEATVPVLMHYKGVCHCYVDKDADLAKACRIIENSKIQRPAACNSLECLLVHREAAPRLLPMLAEALKPGNVEFRADERAIQYLGGHARAIAPEDLGTEFGDYILAVVVVDNLDEAISHINKYGSRHTDIICSNDYANCMEFLRRVDASMVAVNASTRFNDGAQLGLGAEIGISTSKLHAYGPMGVNELTTSKFIVLGNGQTRA